MPSVSTRTAWLVLSTVPSLVGCGTASNDDDGAVRRDSAGVVIVENTGEDRPLPWSYEISYRLGGEPDGPEQFYQVEAQQVATDSSGNIHVLDAINHRVIKFDRDGDVQWMAGTEGGGPGEFRRPLRIRVDHAGTVYVMDYGKKALVQFDSAGTPIGQTPYGSLGDAIPTRYGTFGSRRDFQREGGMVDEIVKANASDTVGLLESPVVPIASYRLEGCGFPLGRTGPVIFGKETDWSVSGRTMTVSTTAAYTVDMLNLETGMVEGIVRRSLPSLPATETLAIEWATINKPGRIMRSDGGECVPPAEEVVEKQGMADSLPMIDEVQIDRRGRLWVQRFAIDSTLARIDVFDPEGVYLGTLPEGHPWPVAFAPPDRILFVEQDDMDIQRLVIADLVTDERGVRMGEPSN